MKEAELERRVSRYIGHLPVIWLDVNDKSGPASDRGLIEAGSIAILSNVTNPLADPPSHGWLGNDSPTQAIRTSGLWNVNHTADPVNTAFLTTFEGWAGHQHTGSLEA